jgi:hypothetical protein
MKHLALAFLLGLASVTGAYATELPSNEKNAIEDAINADLNAAFGFRCCASDAGYEEHGPHCVQAVTRIGGDERAKAECHRYHPRCVSDGCSRN